MSDLYLNGVDQTSGQLRPTANADTTVVIGNVSCPSTGTNSERFGRSTTAAGNNSLVVGYNSSAFLQNCIAIGPNNQAGTSGASSGGFNITIGNNNLAGTGSTTNPTDNICIGDFCQAGVGTNAANGENIAIGEDAIAGAQITTSAFQYQTNMAIGLQSWAGGDLAKHVSNIAFGEVARAGTDTAAVGTVRDNIAIGDGAFATGKNDNIAIGDGASTFDSTTSHDNICIGDFGQAGGFAGDHDNISLGNSNIIYGLRNIGIGFGTWVTSSGAHDTILMGAATGNWGGSLSQSNSMIAGSSAFPVTDVWFGSGMNTGGAAPTTWNLRGSENWGSVSNKNGGRLNIVAGRGFNGGTGGDLYLQTSNVAPTNGTSNPTSIGATQDVGVFDHLGNARVGLNSTTETSTDGFIYVPAGTTTAPPAGTPTAFAGMVPIWFDTTNNLLWIYNGSWKSAAFV